MRNAVLKIKNLLLGIPRSLVKHQVTVFTSIILTIAFLSIWTLQEVDHAKEVSSIKKENILLKEALIENDKALKDTWDFVGLQTRTVQKYEDALDRAQSALNKQAMLLNDLIEYLKKIKHWPPKEPRPEIDPDKWIIFIEE
jgi:hypothetical protein